MISGKSTIVKDKTERQVILRLVVMKVLYIDIERPAILPPTIVKKMVFMMMKFLKCLRIMEDLDIDILIPTTLLLSIMEFITVVKMVEVHTCLKRLENIPLLIVEFIKVVIKVVTIIEVDLGLNIPSIITI